MIHRLLNKINVRIERRTIRVIEKLLFLMALIVIGVVLG